MALLDGIGNTPLLCIDRVHVKLECSNPGGSVKDRIARYLLEAAAARGELRPGDAVAEATSGNTGIAMTWVGRELGYRVIIFMPEHMSVERRRMLESLGAEVRLTPREESFAGAIRRRDQLRGRPGHYIPDQFGNPDNVLCHRQTTGAEAVTELRARGVSRLDWFVAGTGTGGTLMGVGQALAEAWPQVRIAAVEPEESAVMSGGEAGDHGIQGIGDGFIPALVDMTAVDEVMRVGSAEARTAAAAIRSGHGYCVGISAGANQVAALRLRDRGAAVLTLWPDCSDRYLSMGLESPASPEVRCPLRSACLERSQDRLRAG